MKSSRLWLFVCIVALLAGLRPDHARAQGTGGDFGIGVMLGEPTGISVKSWLTDNTAFDVGAAWSIAGQGEALHMHADYLRHSWFPQNPQLAFYYGIGGRVLFADDAKAGVRAPLGLSYLFEELPFDLFMEAVPIIDVHPEVRLAGNGAVGIRYYI